MDGRPLRAQCPLALRVALALPVALALALSVALGGLPSTAVAQTSAPGTARARSVPVTLALRPRDPRALAAYAQAVATPGSPEYRRYLSPGVFAARFGAAPRRIAVLRRTLEARGLHPGRVSAGRLSLALTGTPEALRRALRTGAASPGGTRATRLAGLQAIIGLYPSPRARPLAVRRRPGVHSAATRNASRIRARPAQPHASAGPEPCTAAATAAPNQSAYTDDQIAAAYGLSPLYAAGDTGGGVTVAVYELEPDDPRDIATFERCYDIHARISYVRVDGGAGRGAGSDEAAFDIENLLGFAPGVRLLVYQGPNANSGLPGSGPYDTFSRIVNDDRAQVVSVSWGQCEAQLGRAAANAERTLFEQAAVQGQTIVAAAGDLGSEDCDTGGPQSSTRPSVDDPASQPQVIGVGGTTLRIGTSTTETVWNSGGTSSTLAGAPSAGGGGISSFWPMPPAQRQAPARLHVLRSAAASGACGRTSGYCRESPDVAADADPATGYEIYWNGADTEPEPSGWQGLGGTSGAAPLWAAVMALADGSPGCRARPLGFVGPALYRAAADHYAADFRDVTQGDNDFTGTAGGRWAARSGYDPATGLGTPRAAALVADLCADTLALQDPAGQSSALGAAIALRLRVHDARGARARFTAVHLPPGVHLDSRTGRLSGRPEKPGVYHVRTGASDGAGSIAAGAFLWGVGGAPVLSSVTRRGNTLTVTVRGARHGPAPRGLALRLPAGLRPGATDRIRVVSGPASVRVTDSLVRISLLSSRQLVSVVIPVAGVAGGRLAVAVQSGSTGTSNLVAELP